MVQFLFEHGINKGVYVKDAFSIAIHSNSVDIINFFQDNGMKIDGSPISRINDINLFKTYYKNAKEKRSLSYYILDAASVRRPDIIQFLFDTSDTERELFKNCAVYVENIDLLKYVYENDSANT